MPIIIPGTDQSFFLTVTVTPGAGGAPCTISVSPKEPAAGLYPDGTARINNRGGGARWLVWESAQQFQIEFAEVGSSSGSADGDITDLFKETQGPSQSGSIWMFKGRLRKGSGFETVTYKYTVKVTGCTDLDPLIIVDR
jgi:hypothetical protein